MIYHGMSNLTYDDIILNRKIEFEEAVARATKFTHASFSRKGFLIGGDTYKAQICNEYPQATSNDIAYAVKLYADQYRPAQELLYTDSNLGQ
jgi:hypothetical protein